MIFKNCFIPRKNHHTTWPRGVINSLVFEADRNYQPLQHLPSPDEYKVQISHPRSQSLSLLCKLPDLLACKELLSWALCCQFLQWRYVCIEKLMSHMSSLKSHKRRTITLFYVCSLVMPPLPPPPPPRPVWNSILSCSFCGREEGGGDSLSCRMTVAEKRRILLWPSAWINWFIQLILLKTSLKGKVTSIFCNRFLQFAGFRFFPHISLLNEYKAFLYHLRLMTHAKQ
jgi:hypothetical protein